jgi:hypothetical protein
MDVVGVLSVFVSNSKIRSMRQLKLRTDINDVVRWFGSRAHA